MTTTQRAVLSPVHGGLARPVDRHLAREQHGSTAWDRLPAIAVDSTDRTTLQRIADGTLSPLVGPMGPADVASVLEGAVLERSGERWAWGIPILLPLTDAEAARLAPGATAALVHEGTPFGTLEVESISDWDKAAFIRGVYGTDRVDHPGARLWTEDPRTRYVSGPIRVLAYDDPRPFAARVMGPSQTRALVERKGYEQTIAFQTRNPLHRAHEYALVYGAESLLRRTGKRTGVILNPLVGQLKGDDVPAATRMRTYEALIDGAFLGQGDMDEELWRSKGQDLRAQLELIGLDMRMYYGGPREALQHAIYRQNLGFTHFVIGRKHADAPYDDKTPIWGDFDAQRIFDSLQGRLAIRTVDVGFAAYFEELGRVGLVEENQGKTPVNISGTRMRELLGSGQMPDERVMRPCTAQVLMDYYRSIGG